VRVIEGFEVPPYIPGSLKLSEAAAVASCTLGKMRGIADRDQIEYLQPTGERGDRRIPLRAFLRFCVEHGYEPDWDALDDAA